MKNKVVNRGEILKRLSFFELIFQIIHSAALDWLLQIFAISYHTEISLTSVDES